MPRMILTVALGLFCMSLLVSAQESSVSVNASINDGDSMNDLQDEEIICQYQFSPESELNYLQTERTQVEKDCGRLRKLSEDQPSANNAKMAYDGCMYYMKQIDSDIRYFSNLTEQGATIDPSCLDFMEDEEEE